MMPILIVDDNPAMRRAIKRFVSQYTDQVIECDDGALAFAAYEKHLPEWVLMDVEMKAKDGLEATREICRAYPDAQVVIVTKHGDALMREAAQKAGAVGYVLKVNLLALREIIERPDNPAATNLI